MLTSEAARLAANGAQQWRVVPRIGLYRWYFNLPFSPASFRVAGYLTAIVAVAWFAASILQTARSADQSSELESGRLQIEFAMFQGHLSAKGGPKS